MMLAVITPSSYSYLKVGSENPSIRNVCESVAIVILVGKPSASITVNRDKQIGNIVTYFLDSPTMLSWLEQATRNMLVLIEQEKLVVFNILVPSIWYCFRLILLQND
jgi:hypothetical protein